MTLGERIKEAREHLGISGNELASRAGIAQSAISKIERGAVEAPSVYVVAAIAKVLNLSVEDLVGELSITPRISVKAMRAFDLEQHSREMELLLETAGRGIKELQDRLEKLEASSQASPPKPPSMKRTKKS
jgi:transcriptional regulator with XRE-family HTH domain